MKSSTKESSKESSPEKKEKGAEKDEDSINISESAVLKALSTLLKSIEEEPSQNSNHQKLVEHLKKQVWFATSNFKEFYLLKILRKKVLELLTPFAKLCNICVRFLFYKFYVSS